MWIIIAFYATQIPGALAAVGLGHYRMITVHRGAAFGLIY